jgi:uncharacterized protein YceH (UPF0502 family)
VTEPNASTAAAVKPLPLNRTQRRILGVLIEKAICTPENYPLTANSLVAGCNQKSNRDPVLNLPPDAVDEALLSLKDLGLVIRVLPASGRTDRWKHAVKEFWGLERTQRAILAELLLRGPQTEGELRTRTSRMVDVPTLEDLRTQLEQMADRGFVRRVSSEERRRGVVWTHLVCSEEELQRMLEKIPAEDEPEPVASAARSEPRQSGGGSAASQSVSSGGAGDSGKRLEDVEQRMEQMHNELQELRVRLQELTSMHETLKERLDSVLS